MLSIFQECQCFHILGASRAFFFTTSRVPGTVAFTLAVFQHLCMATFEAVNYEEQTVRVAWASMLWFDTSVLLLVEILVLYLVTCFNCLACWLQPVSDCVHVCARILCGFVCKVSVYHRTPLIHSLGKCDKRNGYDSGKTCHPNTCCSGTDPSLCDGREKVSKNRPTGFHCNTVAKN